MKNYFLTVAEASSLVATGAPVVISGTEELLAQLPKGTWIGATTPYFMTADGGVKDDSHLFCTTIDEATSGKVIDFSLQDLSKIAVDGFKNGFSYVVLPAFSEAHQQYALDATSYPGIFDRPLMGWIAGIDLVDIGTVKPKVVNGTTGEVLDNAAVVLHVELPSDKEADIDIINLFKQGDGATITFAETGWSATTCDVDGKTVTLSKWLAENNVDTKLPLVADYSGTMINVSFQAVDADAGTVDFYAPVVAGEKYRVAQPVEDYAGAYAQGVSFSGADNTLSCNCILNYLYAELEGKSTSGFVGPVTFGEIAYMVLNQTLVRLSTTT